MIAWQYLAFHTLAIMARFNLLPQITHLLTPTGCIQNHRQSKSF